MINVKLERALFIIVFIICVFTCMYFSTQIKINVLPINKGLSPEQAIESEYKDLSAGGLAYKYIILDNIMFVVVDMKTGYCHISHAYRNDNSGFMFKVPGFVFKPTIDYRVKRLYIEKTNPLILTIKKNDNKFYISLEDPFNKRDIEVLYDEVTLDAISFPDVNNQYWVCAVENISKFKKIECFYNGEKIKLIDADELRAMYEEVQ